MGKDIFASATLILSILFLWNLLAMYLNGRAQTQTRARFEELTIASVAASMAAPHLSPDPAHIEENIVILKHWDRVAREYLNRQYRA